MLGETVRYYLGTFCEFFVCFVFVFLTTFILFMF